MTRLMLPTLCMYVFTAHTVQYTYVHLIKATEGQVIYNAHAALRIHGGSSTLLSCSGEEPVFTLAEIFKLIQCWMFLSL